MTDQDKRREDITALKQPAELLSNLADMLNMASDSITVHDTDGRFLYANRKTFELHGYTEAEFMALNLHVLEVPASTAMLSERFRLIEESGRASFEVSHYHKDGHEIPMEVFARKVEWQGQPAVLSTATDIIEHKRAEQELKRIEWLLTSKKNPFGNKEQAYVPPYGDLVALNTSRLILDSVGEQTLTDIVSDYLNLLDTSAAVYERNGDYALGIFSSGWCRFMDAASRAVCGTNDNRAALESGRWHCHESCWSRASKRAIETGQPADIECAGGIRLFAVPINVGDEIIGAINFGYGDPPRDENKLRELAANFKVGYEELRTLAMNYESRPPYIIDLAKSRLMTSARLIGDITGRKQAEQALKLSEARFKNMFERHSSIMLMIEPESGMIIGANEASVRFYGYSKAELLSMRIDEINALTPEKIKIEREHAVREERNYFVFPHRLASGELRTVEVHSSPIVFQDQQILFSIIHDITQRKEAEEKLIKSEERYALVIKASEQGIWDWNVETNEVFYSAQWKKQIGYQDHELKNEFNTWVEHLHPDERESCLNAVNSYLAQPVEHFLLEFRFLHKDGTYRWIHNKAASLINNEGKVIRLFGIHTDVTESKLSQAIFKDIVEKNPMSIQILDMEGYPIQINSAHTKLFGVETPSDYSVLKDPQLLLQGFGELFDRIKKGEVVYFPDSLYNVHVVDPSFPDVPIWVKALGFTLNDNNGKPNRIVLMHENVTERKNAEALLNDIIDKNPISIQIVDKAGLTLSGNPAYIQLFGTLPPADFSIFDDLTGKSPELGDLISRVKNGEVVHLPDIYFNAHDAVPEAPDIPLWIRALIFPLKDSGGKPGRFVIMHENITERKISEQELIKAKEKAEESDRLKSAFLANMSHEIRTPMNGILGFAELLKEPNLSGDEQKEYIRIIEKSGARMLNIINEIVDISKIEAGLMEIDMTETNINEMMDFAYRFFKPEVESKGMSLLFKRGIKSQDVIILTDKAKFNAILFNLIKNAIKYTLEGFVEFGYSLKSLDNQGVVPTQEVLEFFVRDTGIGIPAARQEAIFERFIQADVLDKNAFQGAGLGLSISKAYVEMLGGHIRVESEEGAGTTFYFTLPYCYAKRGKAHDQDAEKQAETTGHSNHKELDLKILIVEDDEASELFISEAVKGISSGILKAATGIQAVNCCRDHPEIDLALMDIRMPVMDGYTAIRRIREFNHRLIIIAQTAHGLTGDREKAIEAGADDYISKPVKKEELLTLIQKYFGKQFNVKRE